MLILAGYQSRPAVITRDLRLWHFKTILQFSTDWSKHYLQVW